MELEFNVEDLLTFNKIESERIEYKKGWNPDDIYRSICAFANVVLCQDLVQIKMRGSAS